MNKKPEISNVEKKLLEIAAKRAAEILSRVSAFKSNQASDKQLDGVSLVK